MRKPAEFENHPCSFEYARQRWCLRGVCKHVTDGDTFDAYVDMALGNYTYVTLRLQGIDTAEIFKPSNPAERAHGLAAKARVSELILNKPVLIRTFKEAETFGRYVADVWYVNPPALGLAGGFSEVSLAETLRQEGLEKRASYP